MAKKSSGIDFSKVLKGPKVAAAVQAKAEKVKDYWQSIAPVFGDKPPHRSAPSYGSPGDYKDSVHVSDAGSDGEARSRVGTGDFKAKWIEYGTAHMPPYAPLAKTKARFR
jgi:meiotically up-regulated gene 157 (Mug157) protein